MAVDPKDAQALQAQDAIPQTDSAGNPVTYGSNASTVNAMFPNLPQGAKVVADNSTPSVSTQPGGGSFLAGVPGALASLAQSNPVAQVLGAGKDAIGSIHQGLLGNNNISSNGVDTRFDTDPAIQADRTQSRLQLTPSGQRAQEAAGQIGDIENKVATPVGQTGVGAGQTMVDQGTEDQSVASHDRNVAIQQSNNSLAQGEQDLQLSAQKAAIDPNNYLKKMGVGERAMTAIGLLISGAGAGLTGQPNLANEMLQKNIDRDIAAQKQTYLNMYNKFLGQKEASQTALQRANAATAAQNMAILTTSTGYGTMLNGLQTQISGLSGQQRAEILKNQILQSTAVAKQNIDSNYIGAAKTGDVATTNMYGNMARVVSKTLNPTNGMDRFSLQPRNQSSPLNEMQQPEQPMETETQVQQVPESSIEQPPKESFLDRISKSDEIGAFGVKKK
jgi:hypothetical protein